MSSPDSDPGEPLAWLVHGRQLRHEVDQGLDARVLALERGLGHRVPQRAGGDRVALVVVGVQEALRGGPVDHLGELPAEVDGVLHAEADALSARPGSARAPSRRRAGPAPRGRPPPAASCR